MKYSELFPKTVKEPPKGADSTNHKYLVQGGFIDQLMSGSWTLLPLGYMVVNRINNIIREELNGIGAQEMLMPVLHPKAIWEETGRWDKADEIMYKIKDMRGKDYVLSFTHEEPFLDLARKHVRSYKDLPVCLYHFSTKFRNEPRARSGILRGREFMMKDLYSIHATNEDLQQYYDKVAEAYKRIFDRIGFDFKMTMASGGVFTENYTHEFQVPADGGEDLIYSCSGCEWSVNQELFDSDAVNEPLSPEAKETCPECGSKVLEQKAIEIGNIFQFGTYYSEMMRVTYTDTNGHENPVHFGSYGIGSTRLMGTWVEVSHDERGIIWSPAISPFDVHIVNIGNESGAADLYEKLKGKGVHVLWDDREAGAGEKFAVADMIGVPVRLLVSDKTGEKVEWKLRTASDPELLDIGSVFTRLGC